jgi:hypothetical protein
VWTRFRAHDHAAFLTIERVIEGEYFDPDFITFEGVKDELSVVSAVIITDASMIAPDDKMSTAIVLAD